ncbi:MAG: LysR family transcriptional regulator, partial [Pantoea piersonii]
PSYMAQAALARGEITQLLAEWQMDRLQSYLLLKEAQPAAPVSLLCDTLIAALNS